MKPGWGWLSRWLPGGDDDASEPRWNGRFTVGPTSADLRGRAGAEYIACVSDATKKDLGLGRHAVVYRCFDNGEGPLNSIDRPPVLRARCRLRVPGDDPPSDQEILLDQTVRNAIGIPFRAEQEYTVDLAPVSRTGRRVLSEFLGNRLLARRFLFMRVCSADPGDMEKKLARIPGDCFSLLGASPGGRIVLTHAVRVDGGSALSEKQKSVQAYPLTGEIVKRREKLELPGLYDRYPSAAELFGVVPDLAPIYLDQQARNGLDLRSLEVVMVRRDDLNAFLQRIRSFGLAVVAASIAVVGVFPIHKTPLNGLWVVLGAFVVATAISVATLRASAASSEQ